MSQLADNKLKKVFVNNFFKTKYFKELSLKKYQVSKHDYHQLCYIYKTSPESMIYSVYKFAESSKFDNNHVKKFFEVRYREILKQPFHDEQLYYYFAIKIFCFFDILSAEKELVIESKNQILISYYLMDNIFKEDDIDILKKMKDEKYWFQNYNLILYNDGMYRDLEKSIEDFLIPEHAKKDEQKESYRNFYKENLKAKNEIIRSIDNVNKEIGKYLELKIEKSETELKQSTE